MPAILLQTKLYRPALRPGLVSRQQLVQQFLAGLWTGQAFARKLTLVAAPAGFGKTTLILDFGALLADAAHSNATIDNLKSGWLALDEADNNPVRFLRYVIAALQSALPEVGRTAASLLELGASPALEEALAGLINEIAAAGCPIILTLDDYAGNLRQYADRAFVDELMAWLRFNKQEAMGMLDGLYSRCSGNPAVPRWLGRMFVGGTKPQQQADADAEKFRSSAGAVVIATAADDRAAWVHAGQLYERLTLQMTALNIKSALLNQPIEVAELRSQFQGASGLNASQPQLLMRFGYANALPRSLRRPMQQVLLA